jgi:hypothetical protein
MEDIFKVQNKTLNRLTGNLEIKKNDNLNLRINFEKDKQEKEKNVLNEKKDLFEKLKETQENHKLKKYLETTYIKLIFGLDIIKK